jgi:hypothetical protein
MKHLMAHFMNVDCLSVHDIKHCDSDSIVFKYDETKVHKTCKFVQEKCYSDLLKSEDKFSLFTALGVYLDVIQKCLSFIESFLLTLVQN